jgi:hypothetical protein
MTELPLYNIGNSAPMPLFDFIEEAPGLWEAWRESRTSQMYVTERGS